MEINKGLAIHIIATFIYFFMVLYVYDGLVTTKMDRLGIVFTCFFVNIIVVSICLENNWYDKQL